MAVVRSVTDLGVRSVPVDHVHRRVRPRSSRRHRPCRTSVRLPCRSRPSRRSCRRRPMRPSRRTASTSSSPKTSARRCGRASAVEVTTIWVATAIAAAAGLLLVAQAIGRHLAATSADHPTPTGDGDDACRQPTLGGALGVLRQRSSDAALVPLIAWALSWLFPRGVARLAEPDPGLALATCRRWRSAPGGPSSQWCSPPWPWRRSAPDRARRRSAGGAVSPGGCWPAPQQRWAHRSPGDPAGTGGRSRAVALVTAAGIAIGVGRVVARRRTWTRRASTSTDDAATVRRARPAGLREQRHLRHRRTGGCDAGHSRCHRTDAPHRDQRRHHGGDGPRWFLGGRARGVRQRAW